MEKKAISEPEKNAERTKRTRIPRATLAGRWVAIEDQRSCSDGSAPASAPVAAHTPPGGPGPRWVEVPESALSAAIHETTSVTRSRRLRRIGPLFSSNEAFTSTPSALGAYGYAAASVQMAMLRVRKAPNLGFVYMSSFPARPATNARSQADEASRGKRADRPPCGRALGFDRSGVAPFPVRSPHRPR